ncbi:DNA-binding MarR family transcriptional regulator [Collimonas sp. PA-H2]|uniref:MarR family winged helix-turn-helix transcriptional regulator n=1 Tax=Collimonas sp. PA-H2 TaxID=1881062 RepID=UPI000BF860C5|nr:MarR family transcriptional regulator [Collimonas sp. PA-H2]PFH08500.1 DNA-binding MarR family transcriptional regulator [Collimonas sp. PA-H2]
MKIDLSNNPMKLVGQVYRTSMRLVDGPLRALGFSMGQLPVLVALKTSGALSQAELARIAQVEQPSMAQLLNRMERDGLVQRVPNPEDKRSQLVSLTSDASERMPKGKAVMEAASRQALTGFTKEERDQLMALLLRVNANLDRAVDETES